MMKGNCLIIPKSLQAEMLEQTHKGHQHLYKCKEHTRRAVWWSRTKGQIVTSPKFFLAESSYRPLFMEAKQLLISY